MSRRLEDALWVLLTAAVGAAGLAFGKIASGAVALLPWWWA